MRRPTVDSASGARSGTSTVTGRGWNVATMAGTPSAARPRHGRRDHLAVAEVHAVEGAQGHHARPLGHLVDRLVQAAASPREHRLGPGHAVRGRADGHQRAVGGQQGHGAVGGRHRHRPPVAHGEQPGLVEALGGEVRHGVGGSRQCGAAKGRSRATSGVAASASVNGPTVVRRSAAQ